MFRDILSDEPPRPVRLVIRAAQTEVSMGIRGLFVYVLLGVATVIPANGTAAGPGPSGSKDDPVARDLKALAGTWEVVKHEVNGKKASDADYYSPRKVVISAGKMDLFERGKADLPLKIDPTKKPKAIDVYFPGAMKAKYHKKGIYVLGKDQLTICLPLSAEAERPTKFSSKGFHSLYILRRKQ